MSTTKHKAEHELRLALSARYVHSLECAKWDYVDNGQCEQCDKHDERVKRARARIVRLEAKAKGEQP